MPGRWMNTPQSYGLVSSLIHWIVAGFVLGMIGLGLYMVRQDPSPLMFKLYFWHKSTGIMILGIMSVRAAWRLSVMYPAALPGHKRWERYLAKTIHILLYAALFILPLSGWIMSSAKGFSVSVFGWFTLPDLVGESETLAARAVQVHEITAYTLIGCLTLHIGGALKHHILDRDDTLRRMWPRLSVVVPVVLGITTLAALLPSQGWAQEKSLPVWEIVKEKSTLTFTGQQMEAEFNGGFSSFDGRIVFDPDNLDASYADMTVDVASVTTHSAERDRYILAPAWLAGETFPKARFITTDIERTGDEQYLAKGTLTIKGVSHPLRFPFSLSFAEDDKGRNTAFMDGSFVIRRLQYDIGEGQWTDTEMVGNSVEVRVRLTALQDGMSPADEAQAAH